MEEYQIYQRPSDGKIFRVGDQVRCIITKRSFGIVDRIWQSFEQVRCDIGRMGLVIYAPNRQDNLEPVDD